MIREIPFSGALHERKTITIIVIIVLFFVCFDKRFGSEIVSRLSVCFRGVSRRRARNVPETVELYVRFVNANDSFYWRVLHNTALSARLVKMPNNATKKHDYETNKSIKMIVMCTVQAPKNGEVLPSV